MSMQDWLAWLSGITIVVACVVAPLIGYVLISLTLKFISWFEDWLDR